MSCCVHVHQTAFKVQFDIQSGMAGRVLDCHKCAVRFEPMYANPFLFNTRSDCFRADLIVGKLLIFKGAKTWKTPIRLAYS
jgi:hypothetical protein